MNRVKDYLIYKINGGYVGVLKNRLNFLLMNKDIYNGSISSFSKENVFEIKNDEGMKVTLRMKLKESKSYIVHGMVRKGEEYHFYSLHFLGEKGILKFVDCFIEENFDEMYDMIININ